MQTKNRQTKQLLNRGDLEDEFLRGGGGGGFDTLTGFFLPILNISEAFSIQGMLGVFWS